MRTDLRTVPTKRPSLLKVPHVRTMTGSVYKAWRRERDSKPLQVIEVFDTVQRQQDALARLRQRIATDVREGTLEFPPLPRVAIELGKLAASPDPEIAEAVSLLEHTPQLAAKVVRIASSAAFGSSRPADLRAAAMRLGVFGLRDLAFAASMGQVFRCDSLDALVKEQLAHCFVVAVVSAHATRALGIGERDGFMAGLFHDIGRLAALMALAKYGRAKPNLLDPELASRVSEKVHTDLGPLLLDAWEIGGVVRTVAQHHHDPMTAAAASPVCLAVATVDAADHMECEQRVKHLRALPLGYQAGFSPDQLDDLATAVDEARADPLLAQILA